MKVISRLFWKGTIVVVPVTLSIYLVLLVLTKLEQLFAPLMRGLLGPSLYVPGFGILLTFILILVVGVLVSNFLTGSIIRFFVNLFEKVPLVKTFYNPLRDLLSLFSGGGQDKMKKVVLVENPKLGFKSIGLVTREVFDDLPENTFGSEEIAVYIPMSYMLGGFTAIVPREMVTEVDIPVEQAMKLAITGWIKADKDAI